MNTIIITENNRGLNSNEFWGYALQPFDTVIDDSKQHQISSGYKLIALWGDPSNQNTAKNIRIITFYGEASDEACNALKSLLNSVGKGESTWSVADHKSNVKSSPQPPHAN